MNKAVALSLLAGGSRLTIFGVGAYIAARSDISRRLPGTPTDKAKCILIGGVAATAVGLVGLLRNSKVR